jgi:hypothetical protein
MVPIFKVTASPRLDQPSQRAVDVVMNMALLVAGVERRELPDKKVNTF